MSRAIRPLRKSFFTNEHHPILVIGAEGTAQNATAWLACDRRLLAASVPCTLTLSSSSPRQGTARLTEGAFPSPPPLSFVRGGRRRTSLAEGSSYPRGADRYDPFALLCSAPTLYKGGQDGKLSRAIRPLRKSFFTNEHHPILVIGKASLEPADAPRVFVTKKGRPSFGRPLLRRAPPETVRDPYSSISRYFMANTCSGFHFTPFSARPRVLVPSMGISSVTISSMPPSSFTAAKT